MELMVPDISHARTNAPVILTIPTIKVTRRSPRGSGPYGEGFVQDRLVRLVTEMSRRIRPLPGVVVKVKN
jgi:hypothetical protein